MKRVIWFSFGILALVLGAIGVVLPLLPTTPFVILAAFAFGKSSATFESWLLSSPTFGPIIADWRASGAIAPRFKMLAIGMMGALFMLSLAMDVSGRILGIQLVCLGAAAAFILTRPNR